MNSNKEKNEKIYHGLQSLEELYQAILIEDDHAKEAHLLLELRDWLINISDYDPRTGRPLPLGISQITNYTIDYLSVIDQGPLKDRLSRIISHSEESLKKIIKVLRQKVLREHRILPVYAVREVDSSTMQWLSRKDGRNIREKLAGKPFIKAVNRRLSNDTTENRLFKDFLSRLIYYLSYRLDAIQIDQLHPEYELFRSMKKWLESENAVEIRPWSNLPPNNTLLQDRNYRKIWDSWLWIQHLDEDIKRDHKNLIKDWITTLFWMTISRLKQLDQARIVEQPVLFKYNDFGVLPLIDIQGLSYSINDRRQSKIFHCSIIKESIVLKLDSKDVAIESKWDDQNKKIKFYINKTIHEYDPSLLRMEEISDIVIGELFDKNNKSISKPKKRTVKSNPAGESSDAVIDIFNVRPSYNSRNSDHRLPFILLKQLWESKNKEITTLDLGISNAVTFRSNTKTISMQNIFSIKDNILEGDRREVLLAFSRKLSRYFDKNRLLTYLVPDVYDEFSLVNVRKSFNLYFSNAQPLPRSIASIFSWHSSDDFRSDLADGDSVLVIDSISGNISLTPLVARKLRGLSKKLPDSKGFIWERHPTIMLNMNTTFKAMEDYYKRDGCKDPRNIIRILGLDGALELGDKISFLNENGEWYTPPRKPKINFDQNISWSKISSLVRHLAKKSISLITLGEFSSSIKIKNIPANVKVIRLSKSLVSGGQVLNQWQTKVKEIHLWRDHLPELSINLLEGGLSKDFYLVKDAAITPQKGKRVDIPIKQLFTLPKGRPFYRFPLTQGSEGSELEYMVYLNSPDFPLDSDIEYNLELSYTYGDDDPYELQFIPYKTHHQGMQTVKAEWRQLSDIKYGDLEIYSPAFPPKYDWKDFKEYPNKDEPNKFHDLFEWVKREFDFINDIFTYISASEDRKNGNIVNITNAGYCFVKASGTDDQNYFCHANNLIFHSSDFEDLSVGQALSFVIEDNDRGAVAKRVVLDDLPSTSHNRFSKSLRFPLFTIWNSGHSLSEKDVPNDFKKIMLKGISNCYKILKSNHENIPSLEKLKHELFFLLCIMHKDMPPELSKRLVKDSKSEIGYKWNYRNMAYAIGDASLEWQKKILSNVIKHINKDLRSSWRASLALAIALWRVEKIIYLLNIQEITNILNNLIKIIRMEEKGIKRSMKIFSKQNLTLELELLLALLRTRASDDEKIKMILSPEKELTKEFIKIIDRITNKVMMNNIKLNSRIALQLDKPKAFRRTPDLLYALKMYLTCDSGANTIQITGITDE